MALGGEMTGEGTEVAGFSVHHTAWLRITLSQARRMPQRGQSFHSTGARGRGWSTASGGEETGEGEEASGQSTTLTRRGLSVVLLS
jgi:hypothetical protein